MYDPMLDDSPGCGLEYPNSYWAQASVDKNIDKPITMERHNGNTIKGIHDK